LLNSSDLKKELHRTFLPLKLAYQPGDFGGDPKKKKVTLVELPLPVGLQRTAAMW
jgi:hypothetical protein